jgi:bifunctional non-homologous end joining protein LigD
VPVNRKKTAAKSAKASVKSTKPKIAKKSATKSAKKGAASNAKKSAKRAAKKTANKSVKTAATKTTRSTGTAARGGAPLAEYRRKRDFTKTAEPSGEKTVVPRKALAFVIQKHAASHLHFDLRLELDGVMKSWAVPKGPSRDPSVKRLAMEVEDHPIDYNKFEGTIPAGEYGGGTVMLWDRGHYTWGEPTDDPLGRIRAGYAKGDFKFVLLGERLQGSWVLVRTKRGDPDKPQWLLIKHRDEFAVSGDDWAESIDESVTTGRSMTEIAAGKKRR